MEKIFDFFVKLFALPIAVLLLAIAAIIYLCKKEEDRPTSFERSDGNGIPFA